MTKRLTTLLISLIYLTEGAGVDNLPLALNQRKDCLRPPSTLLSGKTSSAGMKSREDAPSPVNNVAIDLSPGNFDTIAFHQIYEKLELWKRDEKAVSLSCWPTTVEEVAIARRLGFTSPLAEELARLVAKRVEQMSKGNEGKSPQASSKYTLQTHGHPFDFAREVRISGRRCRNIILVTTDNITANHLSDALMKNNASAVRQIIESGEVIPIGLKIQGKEEAPFGFRMVMTEKSLQTLSSVLGLGTEDMKLIVPYAEKLRLEKETRQARRGKEKEAKKDELARRIEDLIASGSLDEAKRLLGRGSILNEFQDERGRLSLLVAGKYLAIDTIEGYQKAMWLLTGRFGKMPENTTAKEFLQQAREAVVDDLLEQGKWYQAWKAAGGPELKGGASSPLCEKVARTARQRENVPEWLPFDQCRTVETKVLEAVIAKKIFSRHGQPSDRAKEEFMQACRELAKVLISLDAGVFGAINNYARSCCLREIDIEEHREVGLNSQAWPHSIQEFKRDALDALIVPRDSTSTVDRIRAVKAFVIMSAFTDATKEFYAISEPNCGPRRLERLNGEPQEDLIAFPGNVYLSPGAEIPSKQSIYARNLFTAIARASLVDEVEFAKEAIAESLRGFINHGLTLPLLYALGIGPYPSFSLQSSLIQLGALPILEPLELADCLDEEIILQKDVIKTTTGHTAIRIFLKKEGYFKGPLTPAIRTVFLYPLKEPGKMDETKNQEETAGLLKDWPRTLNTLRTSCWEGPNAHFIAGGIDFEFKSRQGFERLLDILFPGLPAEEKAEKLQKLCAIREEAGAGGYPVIPESEQQFVDEDYNRLISLMNYYVSCLMGYTSYAETTLTARSFAKAFFEPVYKDLRTQAALFLALSGVPYLKSQMDEVVATENAYSTGFADLIKAANDAYYALGLTGSINLNARWQSLTSWDLEAPKEEIGGQKESRRELWYILMECLTNILSVSLFEDKFPDNILFELDESGHVLRLNMVVRAGQGKDAEVKRRETDAKGEFMNAQYLRILDKLGYRPFIEEKALIDIVNTARAHKSVKVIKATEHSPPSIVITLEKGWEIVKERAMEVFYLQNSNLLTDKLVIVFVDENGLVMDEDTCYEYVDTQNGCLIKDEDGNSELSKVIGGRAKVAIPYILADVGQFKRMIEALAIDNRYISPRMKKILHLIQGNRRGLSPPEAITGIRQQRRVDALLRRSGRLEASGNLDAAAKVLIRALTDFPENTTLQEKSYELTRLQHRRQVLTEAKEAIAARSRLKPEELRDTLTNLESFYRQTSPFEPSLPETALIEAMGKDSVGLKIWRSLRDSVRRSQERIRLISEAESCLDDNPDRAEALVKTAKDNSWGGDDIDRLLERIVRRREIILEEAITRRISELDRLAKEAETISVLLSAREQLEPVEHDIEKVSRPKVQERMIEKIDEVRDAISGRLEAMEQDMAAIRERIAGELGFLKQKIETVPTTEQDLEGYSIEVGPTRENLRVWGRELRSAGREIKKLLEGDNRGLDKIYKENDELYNERLKKVGKLVNDLKKEVRGLLADARALIKTTDKQAAESGIKMSFTTADEIIRKVPSAEAQRELTDKLKESKEFVRVEKEKAIVKEIKRVLQEKEAEISKMEEEGVVEAPDEILREHIEISVTDDGIRQGLLARFDSAAEAYRMRILSIQQKKIRDGMQSKVEMNLRLIRSASPVMMKRWMEPGSSNAYKDTVEYLDSLDTEDPATRAYVEALRREIDNFVQMRLANINGFRKVRPRPRRMQRPVLADIESGLSLPVEPEQERPNRVQRVRLSKLEEQFRKTRSAEGLHAIADKADEIVTNSAKLGMGVTEAKEYADFRDNVRAAARKAPSASELIAQDRAISSAA